jgi:hypothetical protein
MKNTKGPHVPEAPPPVLREHELKALRDTCEKTDAFENRRDTAILLVFVDTRGATRK